MFKYPLSILAFLAVLILKIKGKKNKYVCYKYFVADATVCRACILRFPKLSPFYFFQKKNKKKMRS